MSIKEWVKSLGISLTVWDCPSLMVCPVFEIKNKKNGKGIEKKKKNSLFPWIDMSPWQCFKCKKPPLQDWDILYVAM